MLENNLNGGDERQFIEGGLDSIVVRLQHPDHVVSSQKKFAGIWGTPRNNYSRLRGKYRRYFTPEGITLSNIVAMSEESFRNLINFFKGKELELRQRQAARIERIMGYDRNLDGALTNEIAQAALQEQSSSLTLYQQAVQRQRAGEIRPDVVIYNPFMIPEDVAMVPGQKIYHSNPRWTNDDATWVNEGIFVDWDRFKKAGEKGPGIIGGMLVDFPYGFKETGEKGPGIIVGMLVDFPDAGRRRLSINADSQYYQGSIPPAKDIWGGYVGHSLTARR